MSSPTQITPSTDTAPALKEWAAIVHAILEGEQVIDVRKGGLREDGRHFDVSARRFWLYPTAEHQRAELLKPAYRHWADLASASAVGESITIAGWADVTDVATITEAEHLDAIASKLIWTDEYAASRLKWKKRDPLWVLVLRAYRLDDPITVPWAESYAGCTSWVTLDGLPADPAAAPAHAALSDVAFESKRKGVRESLPRRVLERGRVVVGQAQIRPGAEWRPGQLRDVARAIEGCSS